jgi:hypothetical protein
VKYKHPRKDYEAVRMSQSLAEKLVTKLNLAGLHAEVCDVYCDADTAVMDGRDRRGSSTSPGPRRLRFKSYPKQSRSASTKTI